MAAITSKSRSTAVNPLAVIDRLIADTELTQNQYKEATKSYESVSEVLTKINPLLKPRIFPQGSMRLGTTIRPLNAERFDLDMVCLLAVSGKTYSPEQVFNLVWDALGQDSTYAKMRKKKNRCIRLEYAPDAKYYLDVIPAVPDWVQAPSLYVPDREMQKWFTSHPVGYCDGWFKIKGLVLPTIRRAKSAREYLTETLMANSAYVEQMPEYGQFEKTPLQRIVQMLKRDRDEHFQKDLDHRPSSILLTTIITHSYSDSVSTPVADLLEFVVNVVVGLPKYIRVTPVDGRHVYEVRNPVNENENFAEKWTENNYRKFLKWHGEIKNKLQNLQNLKGRGVDVLLNSLSEGFGSDSVKKAANELGADTSSLHESGDLRVSLGTVGSLGTVIPKTTYYGSGK